MSAPRRAAVCLAGLWAGMIAAIGFVAAPLLFATLPRADAAIGLGVGALLLVLALHDARTRAAAGSSRFSAEMVLVLAALFCIVAGHYAIQPMLASAGRGDGPSFAFLHGVASAFLVVKLVVVAVLAWRFAGATAAPTRTD